MSKSVILQLLGSRGISEQEKLVHTVILKKMGNARIFLSSTQLPVTAGRNLKALQSKCGSDVMTAVVQM